MEPEGTLNPDIADLNRVQRWMHSVITHPDGIVDGADAAEAQEMIQGAGGGNLEAVVTRSNALSAADRLAIYGNAYFARLLDCMGEVFPVLKRTLGGEVFDGFVFGYLQSYPSSSYTLHHLGRHFVKHLEESCPESEDWSNFLIDLAQLEWDIYDVFDGPGLEGKPPFDFNDLLDIPPENWGDLYLKTAPCLRLLTLDYPVNDHYTKARNIEIDPAADLEEPEDALSIPTVPAQREYVALSRRDYVVRRYALNFPQFELLESLQEGLPLGEALGHAADAAADFPGISVETDLSKWFQHWSAEAAFFETVRAF